MVLDNGVLESRLYPDIYQLLRNSIAGVDYLPGKFFTPATNNTTFYRSSLAFRYFTNGLVQKNLIAQMQSAVSEAFLNTYKGILII